MSPQLIRVRYSLSSEKSTPEMDRTLAQVDSHDHRDVRRSMTTALQVLHYVPNYVRVEQIKIVQFRRHNDENFSRMDTQRIEQKLFSDPPVIFCTTYCSKS